MGGPNLSSEIFKPEHAVKAFVSPYHGARDAYRAYKKDVNPALPTVTPTPPPESTDPEVLAARDRARRRARLAGGFQSTVNTSPAGAPYTGQPKRLTGQ